MATTIISKIIEGISKFIKNEKETDAVTKTHIKPVEFVPIKTVEEDIKLAAYYLAEKDGFKKDQLYYWNEAKIRLTDEYEPHKI